LISPLGPAAEIEPLLLSTNDPFTPVRTLGSFSAIASGLRGAVARLITDEQFHRKSVRLDAAIDKLKREIQEKVVGAEAVLLHRRQADEKAAASQRMVEERKARGLARAAASRRARPVLASLRPFVSIISCDGSLVMGVVEAMRGPLVVRSTESRRVDHLLESDRVLLVAWRSRR